MSLGSRGNIVSPNYPDSYPLSNVCYYVLQAAERQAMRIRVAFELLMMQDFYGCSLEFIQVWESSSFRMNGKASHEMNVHQVLSFVASFGLLKYIKSNLLPTARL